jgi:two-component system, OmpR family, alkaline phosphatase synthesis response regulator PhoP
LPRQNKNAVVVVERNVSKRTILVVDDEPGILELVRVYLEKEGWQVILARDGAQAIKRIEQDIPELVVLDVMLPEINGFDVCKRLRSQGNEVPIIMLTARDDDIDKILGLELGADDYLTKPFNPRELVARIKAILRRGEKLVDLNQKLIKAGDLSLDLARREVRFRDATIELRTQEFEVLKVLAEHPGWVFSREKLLSLAWGFDFLGQTRTVDVHIAQIRKKLDGCALSIESVTGIGYKLVV